MWGVSVLGCGEIRDLFRGLISSFFVGWGVRSILELDFVLFYFVWLLFGFFSERCSRKGCETNDPHIYVCYEKTRPADRAKIKDQMAKDIAKPSRAITGR